MSEFIPAVETVATNEVEPVRIWKLEDAPEHIRGRAGIVGTESEWFVVHVPLKQLERSGKLLNYLGVLPMPDQPVGPEGVVLITSLPAWNPQVKDVVPEKDERIHTVVPKPLRVKTDTQGEFLG